MSDDDEVDLGISLEAVATIVDHARALQGNEETGTSRRGREQRGRAAPGKSGRHDRGCAPFIAELNEDEQASLIALAWTGRGDYGPEEWDEARALAAERNEGDTAEYLLEMDNLGDLLAEGVAAFGLSIEDIER